MRSSAFAVYSTLSVQSAREIRTPRKKNGVFLLSGSYFRAHTATWRCSCHMPQTTQPAAKGLEARMWGRGRWVSSSRRLLVATGWNLFTYPCWKGLAKKMHMPQSIFVSLLFPTVHCRPECHQALFESAGRTCALLCWSSANKRTHETVLGPVWSCRWACAILGCTTI